MPRPQRIVVPGLPHHITHRGNKGDIVFRSDIEREKYIIILKNESDRYGLRIVGYCLMPNHMHVIAVPEYEHSLEKGFGIAQRRFSR